MRRIPPVLSTAVFCILALFLTGCAQTRSISDSGFRGRNHYSYNPAYKGELSEFDVVGVPGGTNIAEAQIQEALSSRATVRLPRGEPVLVIQSGALTPDDEFMREFDRYFASAPFSGQPAPNMEGYSARLRLAAAQGG